LSQQSDVRVETRYKDISNTFSGKPEEVWLLLNNFFAQFMPSFETADRLTLKIDLQKLAKDCEGMIAFAHDGPVILIQRDRLTDNETILLRLLAAHLGKALGKSASETISKDELQVKLGKNPKIVSTRLSELVKNEFVSKGHNEDYRLTDLGVMQMQKEILPKVRNKIQ
jgi:hypothetical protein